MENKTLKNLWQKYAPKCCIFALAAFMLSNSIVNSALAQTTSLISLQTQEESSSSVTSFENSQQFIVLFIQKIIAIQLPISSRFHNFFSMNAVNGVQQIRALLQKNEPIEVTIDTNDSDVNTVSAFRKENMDAYIPETDTELIIWILGETADAYEKDFDQFQAAYPNITLRTVFYSEQETYFNELQKAFSQRKPPDIFLTNEEWFRIFADQNELSPAPLEILSLEEITEFFYPIAQNFIRGEKVWAAPLFGNFVIMLSNRNILQDERIFVANRPAKTWSGLLTNYQKYQEFGDTKILPMSLGNPELSAHTFDIFLLLLRQSNTTNFATKSAQDALSYLMNFTSPIPNGLPKPETEGFLRGRIAVIFGTEKTVETLKKGIQARTSTRPEYLTESSLQKELLPQLSPDDPKTIGEIWGFAVSKRSINPQFSWALITSLIDERKAREHFLKTHHTSLLMSIPNGVFSESATIAISADEWQTVDFETIFRQNVLAFLADSESKTLSDVLMTFQQFFSSDDE